MTAREKVGVGKEQYQLQDPPRHPQPNLDPRIKRRFAVENSVIHIQKYIIQTLKRQRPHLSNNNLSVFKDLDGNIA